MIRVISIFFIYILSGCVSPHNVSEVETTNQKNPSEVDVKVITSEGGESLSIVPQVHVFTDWEGPVQFLGHVDTYADKAKGSGILYSGDAGAAGLLAQILTHAAISNSIQKKKSIAKQESANLVLEEYIDFISRIDHDTLVDNFVRMSLDKAYQVQRASEIAALPEGDLIVKVSPQYSLSSDQRSMMLKMEVRAYLSSVTQNSEKPRSVKVISDRIELTSVFDKWVEGSPTYFEKTAYKLFAEGLDLVIDDFFLDDLDDLAPQKTYSYMFGERKNYERGSLLRRSCNRTFLRNLKQDLVVISSKNICEDSDAIQNGRIKGAKGV